MGGSHKGVRCQKKDWMTQQLEAIAEVICGSGRGAGGGSAYDSPGQYHSKSEIYSFFSRASIEPSGQSSIRKWFLLKSLLDLNRDPAGSLLPAPLERVLLRLGNPKEYRGDAETIQGLIDYLHKILQVEGVEIIPNGVEPILREKSPGIAPPLANKTQIISPPTLMSHTRLVGFKGTLNGLVTAFESHPISFIPIRNVYIKKSQIKILVQFAGK